MNCLGLYFIAPAAAQYVHLLFIAPHLISFVYRMIGSSAFIGLYLAGASMSHHICEMEASLISTALGGVVSSLTSLLWHRSRGDRWGGSEGASGAIYTTLCPFLYRFI